jgi:hypothetical protein
VSPRELVDQQGGRPDVDCHVPVKLPGLEFSKAVEREARRIIDQQPNWRERIGRTEDFTRAVWIGEICSDLPRALGNLIMQIVNMGKDCPSVD